MASGIRVRSPSRPLHVTRADVHARVQSWPQGDRSVTWYKGGELFNPVLLPYLDQQHEEQLKAGIVTLNEKGTTEENYPY